MKITREQIDKEIQYFIISPDGFANVNGQQILEFWRYFREMIENADSVEVLSGKKWQLLKEIK